MPEGMTRICLSRQAEAGRSRVSTFVNAVEFSKTGAASDGVKKPPTRARGHRKRLPSYRIRGRGPVAPVVEFVGLFNAARLDGPGSIAPIRPRSRSHSGVSRPESAPPRAVF